MRKKAVGAIMLGTGGALFYWGYHISQSVSAKLNQALNGSPPDKAMIFMVLGGLCALIGFFQLFKLR